MIPERIAELFCMTNEYGRAGFIEELDPLELLDLLETARRESVQAEEIRRLRADHAEMVARNRVLRDRPDLPAERLASYQAIVAENERLKTENAGLRKLCGEADNLIHRFVPASYAYELSDRLSAASKGGET